jgi:hypothetical protein
MRGFYRIRRLPVMNGARPGETVLIFVVTQIGKGNDPGKR